MYFNANVINASNKKRKILFEFKNLLETISKCKFLRRIAQLFRKIIIAEIRYDILTNLKKEIFERSLYHVMSKIVCKVQKIILCFKRLILR